MSAAAISTSDQQFRLARVARHVRQRRHSRRDQILVTRLSLGSLQALMGLAAYQARAR